VGPWTMTETGSGHTHHQRFRLPRVLWDAYSRVADRLGTSRTALLLDHIRADITEHGDARDLADLEKADAELAARRARKGGRPRKDD
jgi:hypothetical protein